MHLLASLARDQSEFLRSLCILVSLPYAAKVISIHTLQNGMHYFETRSSSYHEGYLNRSFQRRENGFPVLEELLTSKNGGDQLVALVCNANTVAKKLRSGSFTSESSTSSNGKLFLEEPMSPETINSWELMAGLEEEQEHSEQQRKHQSTLLSSTGQEGTYDINSKRSKSFHLVREDELSIEGSFAAGVMDHESNRHNQLGFTRSRSFHTFQEYEAIVAERKRWLKKQEAYLKDPVTNIKVCNSYASGNSSETCCDVEVDQVKYCLREEDEIKEKSLIEESVTVLETHRPAESSDIETRNVLFVSCGNLRVNDQVNDVVENVPKTRRYITTEKGSRRKAMAKKLTSLSIRSSTIEFPAIGSLGEWINGAGEQVYTSEAYVTPKFGSFCLQVPMKRNNCIEDFVFGSEMVAAFEQAMQQLEVEEESVLKQIGGDFEEGDSDTTKEKKDAA